MIVQLRFIICSLLYISSLVYLKPLVNPFKNFIKWFFVNLISFWYENTSTIYQWVIISTSGYDKKGVSLARSRFFNCKMNLLSWIQILWKKVENFCSKFEGELVYSTGSRYFTIVNKVKYIVGNFLMSSYLFYKKANKT